MLSTIDGWHLAAQAARSLRSMHKIISEEHIRMQKSICCSVWADLASIRRANRLLLTSSWTRGRTRLMQDVISGWLEEVDKSRIARIATVLEQGDDEIRPLLKPLVAKCLQKARRKTFGLHWRMVGDVRPVGQKLINSNLASALKEKAAFSEQEWLGFGIQGLQADHYIKSGSSFYRPLGTEAYAQALAAEVLQVERAARISRRFNGDIGVDAASQLLGDAGLTFVFFMNLCLPSVSMHTSVFADKSLSEEDMEGGGRDQKGGVGESVHLHAGTVCMSSIPSD